MHLHELARTVLLDSFQILPQFWIVSANSDEDCLSNAGNKNLSILTDSITSTNIKLTPDSAANAEQSIVLPTPGGP